MGGKLQVLGALSHVDHRVSFIPTDWRSLGGCLQCAEIHPTFGVPFRMISHAASVRVSEGFLVQRDLRTRVIVSVCGNSWLEIEKKKREIT